MSKGVYCGWAQVLGENLDAGVHIMAMNIGNRPTFADADGVTVVSCLIQAPILHCSIRGYIYICCRRWMCAYSFYFYFLLMFLRILQEVHILHNYGDVDFYGKEMRFVILGFIREEMEFKSLGKHIVIRTSLLNCVHLSTNVQAIATPLGLRMIATYT